MAMQYFKTLFAVSAGIVYALLMFPVFAVAAVTPVTIATETTLDDSLVIDLGRGGAFGYLMYSENVYPGVSSYPGATIESCNLIARGICSETAYGIGIIDFITILVFDEAQAWGAAVACQELESKALECALPFAAEKFRVGHAYNEQERRWYWHDLDPHTGSASDYYGKGAGPKAQNDKEARVLRQGAGTALIFLLALGFFFITALFLFRKFTRPQTPENSRRV